MNTEELLRPRYKVIAKYPGCFWEIGDVFHYENHKCFKAESQPSIPVHGSVFSEYPHLFKKLEWWEDRNIDEMPEYVKVVHEGCAKDTGLYCKVYKWHVYPDKWPYIKGQMGAEIEGYCPDYLTSTELNFPGQI